MRNIMNLYLSLYPFEYSRKSALYYRIDAMILLLFVLFNVAFLVFLTYEDDGTSTRYFPIAILGTFFFTSVGRIGQGLDVGAFGESLRRHGKTVYAVAGVLGPLIGWPCILLLGYVLAVQFGGSGEPLAAVMFIFGAAVLVGVILSLRDLRKRYLRFRDGEASHE